MYFRNNQTKIPQKFDLLNARKSDRPPRTSRLACFQHLQSILKLFGEFLVLVRLVNRILLLFSLYFIESKHFWESQKKIWSDFMVRFFFPEDQCRQNWKFVLISHLVSHVNFQFWRHFGSEEKKHAMELLQIFFWDSSKYSLLIKYNENTQKIRFTKRFNTKTSSKSPRKYCKRWKSAILEVFGGLLGFRALNKSNFWGMLVLFFRKYTLERVFTKNLSEIYGLVLVLTRCF